MRILSAITIVLFFTACSEPVESTNNNAPKKENVNPVKRLSYSVDSIYAHNSDAFTEGLAWFNNQLIESTGAPTYLPTTKNIWGPIDLENGTIQPLIELPKPQYFGEGNTVLNGKVYYLTYQKGIGLIFDLETGNQKGIFNLPTLQGWGMTNDSTSLIMGDGSNKLYFIHPETFKVEKKLTVTKNGKNQANLNELEYVDGFIWANIYLTNTIVKINAETGHVVAELDVSELKTKALKANPKSLETNGIAYQKSSNTFWITGKMWPMMYQISIQE